jgi:4-hydroxy-tetrahydrodipicolinate synthase
LYYKELMVLEGHAAYATQLNPTDQLSSSQRAFLHQQWSLFKAWWSQWPGAKD